MIIVFTKFSIIFAIDENPNVHNLEFVDEIRQEYGNRLFKEPKVRKNFSPDEIMNELDRIFGPEKTKQFMNDIRQYSTPLLKGIMHLSHGIPLTEDPEFIKEYTAIRSKLVMMVLPLLVYENIILFNTVPKKMSHPCVLVINSVPEFNILLMGEHFCTAPDLETGAVCLLGLYMFLGDEFPGKRKKIHIILQNLFFEIYHLPGNTPEPFCEQIRRSFSKENAGSP